MLPYRDRIILMRSAVEDGADDDEEEREEEIEEEEGNVVELVPLPLVLEAWVDELGPAGLMNIGKKFDISVKISIYFLS